MYAYKMSYFLAQLKSCFWTLTKNDMADKRFSFVMEADVQKVIDNRTPENTTKHTRWSTNVYKAWAKASFLVGHSILTISDFNSFRFFWDTLYTSL
jgi:hypothetical protein